MSASLNHDPKKLYARISCAAAELRAHGNVLDAFARVVDDMRHEGFPGLAEALRELVKVAKDQYDGESEALADMTAERDDAQKEYEKSESKVTSLENTIADMVAAGETVDAEHEEEVAALKDHLESVRSAATNAWALLDRIAKGESYHPGNVPTVAKKLYEAIYSDAPAAA